jgi:hypothetical protein
MAGIGVSRPVPASTRTDPTHSRFIRRRLLLGGFSRAVSQFFRSDAGVDVLQSCICLFFYFHFMRFHILLPLVYLHANLL